MTEELDKRLNAFRPDLADIRLEDRVRAGSYVEGELSTICVPKIPLRSRPDVSLDIETEALFGEEVYVFEQSDGWSWVQLLKDKYVGYVPTSAVALGFKKFSYIVDHPRTFLYPEANIKRTPRLTLSMGSRLDIVDEIEENGTRFLVTREGEYIFERHCKAARAFSGPDYVNLAGRLLETPYRWGGASAFGIDCSGLVQLSMFVSGTYVQRDSDMQVQSIGQVIEPGEKYKYLERGDLVFWDGHVAIVEDNKTLIHANGYTMSVVREPLSAAIKRIEGTYGKPTLYKRP